jgi:ankyrin repeat protein
MIKGGADVNAASITGWTALIEGTANGHPDVCALLVSAGADLHRGSSLLEVAILVRQTPASLPISLSFDHASLGSRHGAAPFSERNRATGSLSRWSALSWISLTATMS